MTLTRLSPGRVATIEASCSIAEAARLMTMFSVGALVIAEAESSEPLGIVTDRDLMKLIGEGSDPATTTVAKHVGAPLATASASATPAELLARMREAGVRRLPLLDSDGTLVGLVSLDDLLIEIGRELGDVAALIQKEFATEHPIASARPRAL